LKKDIVAIENVQRRATKQIPNFRDLSYSERLQKLGLPTLTYRRHRGDMIELYKILTGKYDPSVSNFIHINHNDRRGHNLKIYKQHTRLDVRKHSFPHRCTNLWNNLPANVVTSETVKMFESRLDRLWQHEDFKYNYEANPPAAFHAWRTSVTNIANKLDLMEEAKQGLLSEEDL
jgi:hypothetical protein